MAPITHGSLDGGLTVGVSFAQTPGVKGVSASSEEVEKVIRRKAAARGESFALG
tara:strand:+ start:321 stop:482 length:162 start_codon:yes stop_codon:yes gene_type:complete